MPDPGSPQNRLQEVKKQAGILTQDTSGETAERAREIMALAQLALDDIEAKEAEA